ncbi:MAG: KpsF/GutQ family sugar-phosphate isomerase [Ignavibacteria bacterium]|nr:KpsF/GutQ family sugar-phosphate isomerase [Ignavibacteria bacterium]
MKNVLTTALEAIAKQKDSLDLLKQSLTLDLEGAVSILKTANKVITTGIGKSGFVARKMAATLTSMKIPSVYVHPVDALHGDSGILELNDVVVSFSKSGETYEVLRFCELAIEMSLQVLSVTSRSNSSLATLSTAHILAPYIKEYDSANILPTTSSTSALVVADILAVVAAEVRVDIEAALRESHPQGMIGQLIMQSVEDVMHTADQIPRVQPNDRLIDCIGVMTAKSLGLVCVCDAAGGLVGVLTDGDLRRLIETGIDIQNSIVSSVCNTSPVTVQPSDTLHTALTLMENREKQISVIPVVRDGKCVGVIRVHDIIRANI